MAALLLWAVWQQPPLSVQQEARTSAAESIRGWLGSSVLGRDAHGPSVDSMDRPQLWPLACSPCLVAGLVLSPASPQEENGEHSDTTLQQID